MAKYFNTTLGLSMLQDGNFSVATVTEESAAGYLAEGDVLNVANPSHANTLDAVSRRLGVDVRSAKATFKFRLVVVS